MKSGTCCATRCCARGRNTSERRRSHSRFQRRGRRARPSSDRWLGLVIPVALLVVWEVAGQYGQLPRYLVRAVGHRVDLVAAGRVRRALRPHRLQHVPPVAGLRDRRDLRRDGRAAGRRAQAGRALLRSADLAHLSGPEGRDPAADLRLVRPRQPVEDRGDDHLDLLSDLYRGLLRTRRRSTGFISGRRSMPAPAACRSSSASSCPSALPDIFNGLRIGLALSFVLMVTTELVVSSSGPRLHDRARRGDAPLRPHVCRDRHHRRRSASAPTGCCCGCATGSWSGSC